MVGEDASEVRTWMAPCVAALGVVGEPGGLDVFLPSLLVFLFAFALLVLFVFDLSGKESGDVGLAVGDVRGEVRWFKFSFCSFGGRDYDDA